MEAVESYKLLGPIYCAIIWAAVFFVLKKWPGDRTMTISKHVAAYREAYLFFAIVRTLSFPMFFLFLFRWFLPELEMPTVAYVLMALAISGDLISAWIPETTGWKGRVHKWSAYGMAATVLPFTIIIALSPHISTFAHAFSYVAILFMVLFWVLFVTHKKSKEYYLYFQLAYFVLFDIAFLSAAFL